jgi:hypothetical protein
MGVSFSSAAASGGAFLEVARRLTLHRNNTDGAVHNESRAMFWRVSSLLSPVLLLVACGGSAPQPPVQVHRLPSGEEVKVLGIGKINFSASGPALMLKYQTGLSMDDTSALHAEAQRIWADFRKDAERAQVQNAIVSANSAPTGGIVSHGRTYNFVYERSRDGSWREARKQ